MGAADAEEDERPVHRVYVSEFFIGRFPVTNDEYARFVRATGHPPPAVARSASRSRSAGARRCSASSAAPYVWDRDQPPAGHGSSSRSCWSATTMRWRTANGCRQTIGAAGAAADRGGVGEGGARGRRGSSLSVGQRHRRVERKLSRRCPRHGRSAARGRPVHIAPNAYGLYDVCGNVWEWVSDWYGADYYGLGDNRDPARSAVRQHADRARRLVGERRRRRCCAARTGTRCRPTPTPTASDSGSYAKREETCQLSARLSALGKPSALSPVVRGLRQGSPPSDAARSDSGRGDQVDRSLRDGRSAAQGSPAARWSAPSSASSCRPKRRRRFSGGSSRSFPTTTFRMRRRSRRRATRRCGRSD